MFDHCLFFNTTALARIVDKEWTRAFKPFGITPSQAFLLRVVLNHPGLSQHELATELTISRPTATRLLDGLQALHLVERRSTAADARHWAVYPTSEAEAIHAAINKASGEVTRRIQQQIGKENFDETVARVRSVCSALK
ncbi:MAG TPA: MarR family transcriptional regulator [Polaromonas sp.]|uniref:MarR family winged helix-turn-helix transcriptional regulator n=1 Tax=Polaromonas sp. TaxID=1869339 RepID=UPI002D32735F|nr:MarR family transcriptional regulator [Polaromonas sp.]HYW56712.1 MarR family transcriptional regulator [Polaromonas sp.]